MLLVSARRAVGDKAGARAALETLAHAQPGYASIHYELGLVLISMQEHGAAIEALSRVVELEPGHPTAWRLLGDALAKVGQAVDAASAYLRHFAASHKELRSLENALAAGKDQPDAAHALLTEYLAINPTDVFVSHMVAELEMRLGHHRDAEKRLAETLQLAPSFALARYTLAQALYKQTKIEEAIQQLDILLNEHPDNTACLNLKALSLLYLGKYDQSIACYEALLKEDSTEAACWVGYGHALKTVGRLDKAIAALKKAVELQLTLGEAWWQLADLKTFRFTLADVKTMRGELASDALTKENRALLHFALGKALEDTKDYARSFAEYAKGNAVRRQTVRYVADETTDRMRRSKALFTTDFFRAYEGTGCPSSDPIFIVGLTRSGSTLIEQILASHPMIEGTQELPTISSLAVQLRERDPALSYPEILRILEAQDFKRLGEDYIEQTRVHRKLGRALFIDKMPSNFHHLGLIHLILPNAKIIDARRHPLGCGFANFKQHFTHGQTYTYDLEDIGRYYRDYVELMAHFDSVLPGCVHRVIYEDVVANPEREARRLLDYFGVPFDAACLRFYENDRPVLTASAEQVRRPIFRDALEQWRHFEPWLGPLKSALGDVLDAYPAVPVFRQQGTI
jgi:tetratricopeptide (TPR) repeat protein